MNELAPENLQVFEDPIRGRALRALLPYGEYQTITVSSPILLVTRHDASTSCCQACFMVDPEGMAVTCPGCSHARYCSEACLKAHSASEHDAEECRLWADEQEMPHYSLVQMHRAAKRIQKGDTTLKAVTDALVSYEDSQKGPGGWDEESEIGLHRWLTLITKGNNSLYSAYRRLYFAIKLNGFNVKPSAGQPGRAFASGLFPHLALFNHSCTPNCGILYPPTADNQQPRIKLVALRQIEAGEELTIGYVDPYAPGRRESLRKNFFFDCVCSFCVDGDANIPDRETIIHANAMLQSGMAARAAGTLDPAAVRLLLDALLDKETGTLRLARTTSPDALWQWLVILVDAAKGAEFDAKVMARMAEHGFDVMRKLYGDEECPPPAIMPYISFFITHIQ